MQIAKGSGDGEHWIRDACLTTVPKKQANQKHIGSRHTIWLDI